MKKLLIVGFVYPEPDSSAAGRRMLEIISFFKEKGYQISFASTARESEFSTDLSDIGVDVYKIVLNDPSFNKFILQLLPDIVLFDRFMTEEQFGWRIAKYCPDAIRVLDTEDLHFLRHARENAYRENNEINLISDVTKREIASIFRCDLTLIISEFEMALLKNIFKIPESLLVYFPFISSHVLNSASPDLPLFQNRSHFISIGNFRHAPNKSAVIELKKHIWPVLRRELPEAQLHIYGAYCNQHITNFTNTAENFIVKGRADSATRVMQHARAYLAPLRFGAGLKGKLLEAMESGLPGVTTSIGAEGMMDNLKWNGFVADDTRDFIAAAVKIYTDEETWKASVSKGFQISREKFDRTINYQRLSDKLHSITGDLESHRTNNFTGAMLMHHSMQSTRYLSKYIELKNKTLK